MVRVKVCGITRLEDAMTAVEAGADALGFIFVEETPRFVTPERVAPIVAALPPFVTPVGVFWDHPAGHVKAIAEACGLRALQFHGDERPEDLDGYPLPVIKTIKLAPLGELGGRPVLNLVVTERYRKRSEEHTSELQSPCNLVCRLLLEKKKKIIITVANIYTKITASYS